MTVKKLKISFDLDMDVFAKVLALGHTSMNIEAYETAVEPRVSHTEPKLLPKRSMQEIVLGLLAEGVKLRAREISVHIVRAGYSKKSVHNLLFVMKKEKLIRGRKGLYAITQKGLGYEF